MHRDRRSSLLVLAALSVSFFAACGWTISTSGLVGDSVDAASSSVHLPNASEDGLGDGGTEPVSVPHSSMDAAADAAPGTALDAAPADDAGCDVSTSPSATCRALGTCCPAATPYCRVDLDYATQTVTHTCSQTPDTRDVGAPCSLDGGDCKDGLICGLTYPAPTRYACTAFCQSTADCASMGTGFECRDRLPPQNFLFCAPCNPYDVTECGASQACIVTSATAAPSCGAYGMPTSTHNGPCETSHQCDRGHVCTCAEGLGDDCLYSNATACSEACDPNQAGAPCPDDAGTCTLVFNSDFAVCK
jgi:hypothetical protein